MCFATLQNIKKPMGKQRFGASEKVDGNTLYNLRNSDIFMHFLQFGLQNHQKALGLWIKRTWGILILKTL